MERVLIAIAVCFISAHSFASICSRSANAVRGIEAATLKDCRDITQKDLLLVKELDVWLYSDSPLKDYDFVGLSNVEKIHIFYLNQKKLPPHVFQGLSGVKKFWFGESGVEVLTAENFAPMSNIEEIWLYKMDRLASLPANFSMITPKLKHITVQGVAGVREAATVQIAGYAPLNKIPNFKGLKQIEDIMFSGTSITDIGNSFSHIPTLKSVRVSEGLIEQLPANPFEGDIALESASFPVNALTEIPKTTFNNLPSLIQVDVAQNKISQKITPEFFRGSPVIALDLVFTGCAAVTPELVEMAQENFKAAVAKDNEQSICDETSRYRHGIGCLQLANFSADTSTVQLYPQEIDSKPSGKYKFFSRIFNGVCAHPEN